MSFFPFPLTPPQPGPLPIKSPLALDDLAQALRKLSSIATTLSAALLTALATWLCAKRFGLELLWCWTAVTGWVCLLGVVFLLRFLNGAWRAMRVIEKR